MMNKYLLALTSATLAMSASAAPENFTLDSDHTIPTFEVNHLGFTTQRGRFNKAGGKVMLDKAARKGSVELTIETGSLDMGSAAWTAHLADEGLFNVKVFPTMVFKSDHLIFDAEGRVLGAEGTLTLIGATKPVLVTITNFKCGANPMNKKELCAGDASAELRRSDFGLTKYLGAVGDAVKINVPVEAYKD